MDDTRNSTSKMDETTVLENTAVLSRSQQSLPPSKASMIRTSYTTMRPSAMNGEGRDGTASEVKIGGLLNQISEKEDIQSFIG